MLTTITELRDIRLVSDSDQPLHQQLYQILRQRILTRQLTAGIRLPASRTLAANLAVSRNTVQHALQQLQAEGYLESKQGSGIYVAAQIPDHYHQPTTTQSSQTLKSSPPFGQLSDFANAVSSDIDNQSLSHQLFAPGVPNLNAFPMNIWLKLWHQQLRTSPTKLIKDSTPAGYFPLRQAICVYVRYSRAVNCEPEQVIITNGAQQALDLICRVILNTHDSVIVEDPGYLGMSSLLKANANTILTCPVDEQGLQVDHLNQFTKCKPKLIYTTPSHQYPMGGIMPITRRLNLLAWARQHNTWIIEDDYDSEFHYHARPLPALQSLDQNQSVLYVGSFSKVLLPSLRLGYLIVAKTLAPIFSKAKQTISGNSEVVKQAVVADFISQGHFGRHLRRMRTLYAERMHHIVTEAEQKLHPWFNIHSYGAGMHLVLTCKTRINDKKIVSRLKQKNIACKALSEYCITKPIKPGLILGFVNTNNNAITKGINNITACMNHL